MNEMLRRIVWEEGKRGEMVEGRGRKGEEDWDGMNIGKRR